ncbi:hypothetical protein NP493_423g02025 [Ridgeia piscesae]|uniref:TNFR-Cys domain-containing protein n=1 Tax=Ridgeia piscesae TaxID=27915 RepID=A0AAD9L1T8_RIDPI|nr:hypothetical protein NP493_423g02025 [Ridgeia piscesae]
MQCVACGSDKVMSSDHTKCLACPANCQLCRYNNVTKKAECSKCNDGYTLNNESTVCNAVSACSGSTAVLTSENGTFGISETQYKDYMICKWLIVVKKDQVTHFIATHYVACSFELVNRCKIRTVWLCYEV